MTSYPKAEQIADKMKLSEFVVVNQDVKALYGVTEFSVDLTAGAAAFARQYTMKTGDRPSEGMIEAALAVLEERADRI